MLIILTSFIESTGQMLLYLFIYALIFCVGIFIIYKLFSWIKKCFTGSSGKSSYTPPTYYKQNNTVSSRTNTTRTVNNQTSKTKKTNSNNVPTEPVLISATVEPTEGYSLEQVGDRGYRYTRGYKLIYEYLTPDGIKTVHRTVETFERNAIKIFRYFSGSPQLTSKLLQDEYECAIKQALENHEYLAKRAAKKWNTKDIMF